MAASDLAGQDLEQFRLWVPTCVSIVVPFSGLANFILRILKTSPNRNYNEDYRNVLNASNRVPRHSKTP